VQVAIFSLVFLGERPTPSLILAIAMATAGVLLMSWRKPADSAASSWKPVALGLCAAAFFALAAIGFRGAVTSVASTTKKSKVVHLAASKTKLRFHTKVIHVKHGPITLVMSNPSNQEHAIGIDGGGKLKEGRIATKGETSTIRVTLKKGRYTFYCPVEDHRAEGMVGKIIVG